MNLQLMYKTVERKAIFFISAEEIQQLDESEKTTLQKFLTDNYLKIEQRSQAMYVIKKDLEALMSV